MIHSAGNIKASSTKRTLVLRYYYTYSCIYELSLTTKEKEGGWERGYNWCAQRAKDGII